MAELCLMTLNTSPLFTAGWDLAAVIDAASAAGFGLVALDTFALHSWLAEGRSLPELADVLDAAAVRCWSLAPLVIREDSAVSRAEVLDVRAMAEALHAPWVEVHIHAPESVGSHRTFGQCVELLADSGIGAAIEYVAWHPVDTVTKARAYLEYPGAPAAAIVVDTWHHFRGGDLPGELEALEAEQLAYVQFNDARPAAAQSLRSQAIGERTFPGDGEFPLRDWMDTIKAKGFDGVVSVEVLNDAWREPGADQLEFARRAYDSTSNYWPLTDRILDAGDVRS